MPLLKRKEPRTFEMKLVAQIDFGIFRTSRNVNTRWQIAQNFSKHHGAFFEQTGWTFRGQKPTSLPCFLKSIGSSWLPPSSTSWFWTVLIHICFLENGGHVNIVAQHLQGRSRWSRGVGPILPTQKNATIGRVPKPLKVLIHLYCFWSPNKCIIESHQKMKNSSRGCFFSPPLLG